MADGFVLNVDAKFLQDLEKADKRMSDLVDKSNSLSTSVVNAFNKISTQGVDPFLEKLRQQKNALEAIASIDLGSKPTSEMRKLVKSASDAVDEINRVINALQGASTQMDVNRATKSVDSEIKKETDSYLKNLDEQIQERQKYLLRQEEIEQKRVKISQDAEKQVEKEIKKETDAYLKDLEKRIKGAQEYEQRMIALEESRVRAQKQQLTDYANYELNQLSESLAKHKSYGSQLLANDAHYHNQRQAMYEKLFSLQAKYQAEAGALLGRVYARTGGESWNIQGEDVIKQNQADLKSRRDYINERTRMYEQMFDEISRREKQAVDDFRNYEKSRLDDSLEQYKRNKQDQANVDKHYHNQRQREYDEMFAKIDELAKRESVMRSKAFSSIQSHGDTSKQAEAAYNRLYGDKGVKSINNMNRVLQKLQEAQNKLNLKTDKGRQKYDELGKKIQRIKKDLDKATQANEKFHNSHSKLLNTSDQLQRKLALLFSVSAIQGYMDKLINVRKEFELQQKSLQVLLRDKDQADKLWQQTIDLAIKSPFRVSQLVSYTKQLAAYRIESDKLYDTTKMLSDVSAGLGVDMQRIILAFGQVRAAQFLRGTELRQFTEAGIPMLDELANLFSDLEGRAVSTGEVFERISKRMVLFKDVEQVFERMTSASGIFYKMQEEQSKTLAGMISNLHDSMDIMLNDIGKANEKNIKDLIQMTRTMIDNWRMIGVIIKEVGAAFLLFNLSKFAAGWRMAAGAIAMSDITMKGIAGTAGKLRVALSTLFATIAANPFTAILAASGAAIYALWEYSESINAVNKKYDEMSIREVNVIDKLEALNEKAQENNTIIENNKKSVEERNKAEKENLKILKEVKTKYPELAHLISKQEDGTISLTKAIEAQNEKLIENIALQQKAKGGWFYDSLDENYKDAIEDFAELQSEINSIKVISAEAMAKLSQADISSEDYKKYSELLAEIRKSKDFDSLKVAYNNFTKEVVRNGKEVTKQVPLLGMFAKQWLNVVNAAGSYKQAIKDLTQSFERQKDDLIVGITDAYNKAFNKEGYKNEDEAKEAGANAAGAWIEGFLDDFGIIDENIREWAKIEIPKFVTVDVLYPTKVDTPQDLEDWAKRVKEAITKVNDEIKTKNPKATQFDLFPLPDPGQTREQYLNIAKSVLDIANATYAEGQQIEDEATVNRTKMLSDYADDVEKILNIIKKETTKGAGKDWMSEVIKGVKEAHQEYIKLSKTLDSIEAKQMALDKYEGVFNEASKNANLGDIKLGDLTFETEKGAKDALRMLKDLLPESAKNARLKIEEALSEIEGEVRIKTKVEQDKQILDSIEEMFGSYEISLELQKLNIPPDLAKKLFGVDPIDLSSIRSEIENKLKSALSKGGQEDLVKDLKEQLEKVEDLENKAQQERLEKYTKYLLKAQSERVKIKIDEMNQLSEIEKLNVSELDKNIMRQGVREETQKKLDKAAWEDFKNSDMYIRIFEDLDRASSKALSTMQDKLVELRGSLSELSPENLKEIVRLEEKIAKAKIDKNPFTGLITSIKNLSSARKALNKLEEEHGFTYEEGVKKYEEQKRKIDELQISIKKLTDEYGADTPNAVFEKEDLETLKKANKELADILKKMGLLNSKATNSKNGIEDSFSGMSNIFSQAAQSTNEIADALDKMGALGDAQKDSFETIAGIFGGMSGIMSGAEKMASGNPFAMVAGGIQALGGIASIVGEIFAIGDKKKERQIQREIKFVEDLERAYEKLEKQIDRAYEVNTLKSSYDAAQKNIDAQIESYNKMIAAEDDKKKTDKDRIKEWELAIEDLKEKQREMLESQVEELGGSYDFSSITEEFVNSWLDAFKETGNGLSGLEDNFEDFWKNIAIKQAVMGGASKIMQPFLDAVNKALENDFKLDDSEMANIDQLSAKAKEDMNAFLEQWYDRWGDFMTQGEQSELSGLQRGIQGITEQQADILAAYLNSIRFFVSDNNTCLSRIAESLGNTEIENPMVGQLRIIASQTTAINELLNSLTSGGHSMGGRGFRVFIS